MDNILMGQYLLRALVHYDLLPNFISIESGQFKVMCPFHQDTVPSLNVYAGQGVYHCFACGSHGNVIDLVRFMDNVNDGEILRHVTQLAQISDFSAVIAEIEAHTLIRDTGYKQFLRTLADVNYGEHELSYMLKRGYTLSTLHHFHVKSNPRSNFSVVIPMIEQDHAIGYVARRIDSNVSSDKYRYNRGLHKSSALVGRVSPGRILVVEGVMDMMKAWQYGFHDTVALLGWHCSSVQAEKLRALATEIVCGLDNDRAGKDGYRLLVKIFGSRVTRFPFPASKKDIGEMSASEFRYATNILRRESPTQEVSLSLLSMS